MDGAGWTPQLPLLRLSQPPRVAVPADAGEVLTSVDQSEVQGDLLTSESIFPCAAAAVVVGRPDPSKGPKESCEWLGNDLAEDHVDVVGNGQLQHLIPVRLSLQHHLDRHQ